MKNKTIILTIILFLTACQSDKEHLKGFTSIFNGKDFSGWHGVMTSPYDNPHKREKLAKTNPQKFAHILKNSNKKMLNHWTIKDGVLHFDGSHKGFSIGTDKKYNNFELYVSWKIPKHADSGIYLKGAPQIQIWDVNNKKAHRHGAHKGSGGLWNNSKTKIGKDPLVVADNPIGEWNTFFIRMVDNIVTIYLNDKLVVDKAPLENTYWAKQSKQPGLPLRNREQIELQAHGSKVQFKDIYIKEL